MVIVRSGDDFIVDEEWLETKSGHASANIFLKGSGLADTNGWFGNVLTTEHLSAEVHRGRLGRLARTMTDCEGH
jgi:hypothetical protein